MQSTWIKFLIVGSFIMFLAGFKSAWASDAPVAPTDNVDYGTGVGKKLGRGISNVAFGWLEIPKGVEDVGDKNNFIAAATWGPIYGAGKAAVRTLAGAYEIATFPVPWPKNFEPLVQPEFMLGDSWQ